MVRRHKKTRKPSGEPKIDLVDSTITQGKARSEPNPQGRKISLLKLPTEIRHKIWCNAVKHDGPVIPKQIEERSNKFGMLDAACIEKDEHAAGGRYIRKTIYLGPPTAAQLSLVCHQIYDEVSSEAIFYQINEFEFMHPEAMLVYLVAITPLRAQSIRSVIVNRADRSYPFPSWSYGGYYFLATCPGLKNLTIETQHRVLQACNQDLIDTKTLEYYFPGLGELRGLDNFKVLVANECRHWYGMQPQQISLARQRLYDHFATLVTMPGPSARQHNTLRKIVDKIPLNVHGEGRLGPDKKPSMVSSRTRAGSRQVIDDKGLVVQVKSKPKFSASGDLLWGIKEIKESRRFGDDGGLGPIEMLVSWTNVVSDKPAPPESWEMLDQIINSSTWFSITDFYIKYPSAYHIDVAIDSFGTYFTMESDPRPRSYGLTILRSIKKQLEREAEEAARKAEQAKKASEKSSKTKKAAKKANKKATIGRKRKSSAISQGN